MGTFIPSHYQEVCLEYRDVLNWDCIDLYYNGKPLTDRDLMNIGKNRNPLKKLSYCSEFKVSETTMLHISKFASSLEHLEIGPEKPISKDSLITTDELLEPIEKLRKEKISMPKLKYLKLSFEIISLAIIDMVDLNSFADSLQVLKLHCYDSKSVEKNKGDYNFMVLVKMIKTCKNLVTLSVRGSYFDEFEGKLLFDAIKYRNNLETLDVSFIQKILRKTNHNLDFLTTLPKLKKLDVSGCNFSWLNSDDMSKIHLDYLGAYNSGNKDAFKFQVDAIGNEDCFENVLNYLENSRGGHDRFEAEMTLLDYSARMHDPNLHNREWIRLERVLSTFVNEQNATHKFLRKIRLISAVRHPNWYPLWSYDFLATLARNHF